MKPAILEAVLEARAAGVPVVLATHLPGGEQALIFADKQIGELVLHPVGLAEARRLLTGDVSRTIESERGRVFLHVLGPPPRLVIVGAVHIAEPLARMAERADYTVILIDPRQAFAKRQEFVGFNVVCEWPDEALAKLNPDENTAIVTLTHDPKLDDPALRIALHSRAFYIGSLGSRKTQEARLARLHAAGFTAEEVSRIHGPIGLPIGARSPAEIAVSILAQLIEVRRGRNAR
jgi:xanthine dehydrogenase accessory factor